MEGGLPPFGLTPFGLPTFGLTVRLPAFGLTVGLPTFELTHWTNPQLDEAPRQNEHYQLKNVNPALSDKNLGLHSFG